MFFPLVSKIKQLGTSNKGYKFTVSAFTQMIRRTLQSADLSFSTHRATELHVDEIVISGYYNPDTHQISVLISYSPSQTVIISDHVKWDQLAFDLAECICHEYVHMEQNIRGRLQLANSDSDAEYLAAESEIEAYGFSAAAASQYFQIPVDQTLVYKMYRRVFDSDHIVLLKLHDQAVKYLEQLEKSHEQNNIT
jgi:hypothetical protein